MEFYSVLEEIGKGSAGVVLLARDRRIKQLRAIKRVELDDRRKTRTREAVEREAKILASLSHPHIVHFYDSFFSEPNQLCIVQEYCDGGTLADQVAEASKTNSHLLETLIWKWFLQILLALQYLHNYADIIHRDIKTANVFLVKGKTVKLGDFGIAKTMAADDFAVTCIGTPCYLSPELVQDVPYSTQSDMWSLGCLLYELIALRRAFDANNLLCLFAKISAAEYPPIDPEDRYSAPLKRLVVDLLSADPEYRPSARDLLRNANVMERLDAFIEEKETLKAQSDRSVTSYADAVETVFERERLIGVTEADGLYVVGSKVPLNPIQTRATDYDDDDFEEFSEEEEDYLDDYEEEEEDDRENEGGVADQNSEEYTDDFDSFDSTDDEVLQNAKHVRAFPDDHFRSASKVDGIERLSYVFERSSIEDDD